jgi:hypothetical protein
VKNIIAIFILVILQGCGFVDFYTEENPNSEYDQLPSFDAKRMQPPYTLEKFRSVLDRSKLQDMEGETVVNPGNYTGYLTPHFFALDEMLYFVSEKRSDQEKTRTELREYPARWHTNEAHVHIWKGEIRCFLPKEGIDTYTWMQIHGTNETYDYPLLRLVWVRSREGIKDHLWAILITNQPYEKERRYEWIDLGKRSSNVFKVRVETGDNRLLIYIDDRFQKEYDISYWAEVENYFKAGIYINRHDDYGTAAVAFRELFFK